MQFQEFARANGLILNGEHPVADGRIHRVPTVGKPRRENGAYMLDGPFGWVQDWGAHPNPIAWKNENFNSISDAEKRELQERSRQRKAELLAANAKAAELAISRLENTSLERHPYLARKGFPDELGLVDHRGVLLVPMRKHDDYQRIVGVQAISADGAKLFSKGMDPKGAVFSIGHSRNETWFCEGYATGLTIRAALVSMYRKARVVCCFSASNMKRVALETRGRRFIFVDHDKVNPSTGLRAGEHAARLTHLPWCQSPVEGDDANDLHLREGLQAVVKLIRQAVA